MRIKTKITGMMIGIILLSSTIVFTFTIIAVEEFQNNNFHEQVQSIVEASKADIQSEILKGFEASYILTEDPAMQEWFNGNQDETYKDLALRTLNNLVTLRGYSAAFTASVATGDFYVGSEYIETLSPDDPDDNWFYDTLKSNQRISINIDYNSQLKETMLWVNTLIPGSSSPLGIAGIGMNLDQFVNSLLERAPGEHGVIFILDNNNSVKVSSDEDFTGKQLNDILSNINVNSEVQHITFNNNPSVLAFSEIVESSLKIGIIAQNRDFLPSIFDLARLAIIPVIIFGILSSIVMTIIIKSSFKPLKNLGLIITDMSNGEGDLTHKLAVSKDEIGVVSSGLNKFISLLREIMFDVKQNMNNSMELTENLNSSSVETSAAVEEITATLNSISKQIENLDTTISSSFQSLNSLTDHINLFDKQVEEQTLMVEQTTSSITEMKASLVNVADISNNKQKGVENLKEIANSGVKDINDMIDSFKVNIIDKMEDILEMNSMVASVAARTNLLAMNAAIEAAHAGEAGKGFSVVADEIRKLAEATSGSSKQISIAISDIRSGVDKTSEKAQNVSKVFNTIDKEVGSTVSAFVEINSSAQELSVGSDQVLSASMNLNNFSTKVRESSLDMTNSINTLSKTFETVRRVSADSLNGVNEVEHGSIEIMKAMGSITSMNSEFLDGFKKILEDIDKFKTE